MRKHLLFGLVCGLACVAGVSAQEFPTGPTRQFGTTNEISGAVKQDPWQSDRYNFIDPRTGRRSGGFVKRDTWEPEKRWNVYDAEGRNAGRIERDDYESDRWNITEYDDGIGEYDDGTGGD